MQNGSCLLGTLPLIPGMLRLLKHTAWPRCPSCLGGSGSTRKPHGWFAQLVLGHAALIGPTAQSILRPGLGYMLGADFWSLTYIPQMHLLATESFWCFIILEISPLAIFYPGTKPLLLSCQRIYLYMSSPWNSPKIHVSHDHTQIPHQAAFLTCSEILLF